MPLLFFYCVIVYIYIYIYSIRIISNKYEKHTQHHVFMINEKESDPPTVNVTQTSKSHLMFIY